VASAVRHRQEDRQGRQGGQEPVEAPAAGALGAESAERTETPEQQIARLQARVRQLEAETTKLTTEREILRSAAKYFAEETNW